MKKTIYSFKNKTSLGIDLVPNNSIIEVENSDGQNRSLFFVIKENNFSSNDTIEAVLQGQIQVINEHYEAPIAEEYAFSNISAREIVDIGCNGADYLIHWDSELALIIAEPTDIVLGSSGIIELDILDNQKVEVDASWVFSGDIKKAMRYTVLPSGAVVLTDL